VFTSEVDNNLGASFVILGLVTSVPNVVQSTWKAFTDQTLFLRPHVKSLVYCLRVLEAQRAAVEKEYNGTFYMTAPNNRSYPVATAAEYAPIIFVSADVTTVLLDLYNYTILQSSIIQARDTGNFSLSAPYTQDGIWRMGSFLPHYGETDPTTLTTVAARRANCIGYVVTVLNVQEVFSDVISRLVFGWNLWDRELITKVVTIFLSFLHIVFSCSGHVQMF
jgi:histidine kinase 2/3/4 (cytokinin receptor)